MAKKKKLIRENRWKYKGKILEEVPKDAYGFVYKVVTTKGSYIGQKRFFTRRNKKISKKRAEELYSGRGRRPTKELVITESNWKTYRTSNKELKILDEKFFKSLEVLYICSSLNMLNIMEVYAIITEGALFSEKYLNGWAKFTLNKELNKKLEL